MAVKLTIEAEERPWKAIVKIAAVLLFTALCFAVAAVVSLAALHLFHNGWNEKSLQGLAVYFNQLYEQPSILAEFYRRWWNVLLDSVKNGKFGLELLMPFSAPLISLLILAAAYLRSSYSFLLWYVLNHHFAKEEDVEKMGLTKGLIMVLGRFQEHILGINRAASVLCFGEAGSGKTTSVAIPSILRSDNCSVLAADNSGTLARYTSGYRATLGKVFYFNWDLQDDAAKGNYYPRWNPLAKGNLPSKGGERDEYLSFVAGYLVSYDRKLHKDNYWEWLTYSAFYTLLQFMLSKTAQAEANDYFLNQILEKGRLSKDDKDVLLSYYALMPAQYSAAAMQNISKDKLTADDYMPVGSWDGIPPAWQGKEICLSMIADWIMKNYLTEKKESVSGDWKNWLERMLAEAKLFNYSTAALNGLEQMVYLSKKQRQIVFPMLIKPLMVFRNAMVRERTSGNDFCMTQLRGIKNYETKGWEPVTVYCTANTKSTKFINRMFLEAAVKYSTGENKFKGPFPVMTVVDDIGQMLKIKALREGLSRGPRMKTSFLLLCNSLHNIENIYSKETLEDFVSNTNYKIIMAEDSQKLSRQLNKLAIFGTKSVQIPADKKGLLSGGKGGFADAVYYHRLAKDLQARRNFSVETKGYQLLLAEGYYHRPVLTKDIHFLKDEKFKKKSLMGVSYFLDSGIFAQRNIQDQQVPGADEVLYDSDIGIDDETELNEYVDIVYDQALGKVQEAPDKTTALMEDISNKWQSSESGPASAASGNDWWLEEDAFERENYKNNGNPFEKK